MEGTPKIENPMDLYHKDELEERKHEGGKGVLNTFRGKKRSKMYITGFAASTLGWQY